MPLLSDADRLVARFHAAVDLWATSVMLRRQTIRRRNPEASGQDVEALLNEWLQQRPGAEMGDGPQPDLPHRK